MTWLMTLLIIFKHLRCYSQLEAAQAALDAQVQEAVQEAARKL